MNHLLSHLQFFPRNLKKDKNDSTQIFPNANVKKYTKANEDSNSAENDITLQKEFSGVGESNDPDIEEFQLNVTFIIEINTKMPTDFKFDFVSSVFLSLPLAISDLENDQNNKSISNLSAFESSSLDFKIPASTTFDFLSG